MFVQTINEMYSNVIILFLCVWCNTVKYSQLVGGSLYIQIFRNIDHVCLVKDIILKIFI